MATSNPVRLREIASRALSEFRKVVWRYYRKHGRHDLPWRKTLDPYRILVSEVMLQQTQVERVIPHYRAFLRKFPTARRLAAAPLSNVLRAWQGLGYNRRAKMLHLAAKELVAAPPFGTRLNLVESHRVKNSGTRVLCVPNHIHVLTYRLKYGYGSGEFVRGLEALPGVGPYTARAVAAFARNEDVVFIETNIRTAILHHFFPPQARGKSGTIYHSKISDAEIEKILATLLPKGRAREWYSALMDYGAHLKRTGVRVNARSSQYAKQGAFKGSAREARGAILRELMKGVRSRAVLTNLLGPERKAQVRAALGALVREGLVKKQRNRFGLA